MSRLYLIPAPLGDNEPSEVIPGYVLEIARGLSTFVVEETRTARRYLSRIGLKGHIQEMEFHELNEHTSEAETEALLPLFSKGDVGLISEAGLPAVADPGARLVDLCHRNGIEVVPLVGPSSLMLALMGSGLNGQSFAFHGYLPVKPEERAAAIRKIEKSSATLSQTQIFIETPYRNDAMFKDLLRCCSPKTLLTVAANLTMPDAFLKTRTVGSWKKENLIIGKRPCVFLLLAQS